MEKSHNLAFVNSLYQSAIAYPISQGQIINTGAVVADSSRRDTIYEGPWFAQATHDEMISHFPPWDPQGSALLNVGTL